MSLNIGELVAYVKVDHAGVGQGITAAQRDMRSGMDRLASDAKGQGEKAGQAAGEGVAGGFKRSTANLVKIAVGAFAVEKVVQGLRTAKDAASDLNETTSMSSVIFGRNAAAMKAWAQDSPRALGLSTEAALRYSASLADMLLQLNFTEQASADLSKSTLQMAADLGSFKNLGTEDVLERINASLRGEYDSLQLLIPNINAARVEQEALAATGKSSASALSAQEKATATLAIIQKDGARASGDFARTRNGEADASKTAAAETANLVAKLGQGLLPAYTALVVFGRDEVIPFLEDVVNYIGAASDAADPLTDAIGGMVGAFRDLPGPVQAATVGLIAMVALRGRVEALGTSIENGLGRASKSAGSGLDSLRLGLMYASESSTTAAGRFTAVTKSLGASAASGLRGAASGLLGVLGGPWGLAFAGAVAVVGTYIKRQQEAKARVDALTGTLDAQTGAITDNTKEWVRNELETSGVLKTAQRLGVNLQDVYDAALGNADALARVNDELARLAPATAVATGAIAQQSSANAGLARDIADVRQAITGQTGELGEAVEAGKRKASITVEGAKVEGDMATAVEETTGKVKDQAEAIRDAAKAVLDSTEAKLAAFDAEIGYQAALDDTAAAIEKNGKTAKKGGDELNLNTEKGRENASALTKQATEAKRLAEENINAGDSLKSVRTEMDSAREAFIKNAEKAGLSKEAAEKMATQFGLTRGTVDNLAKSVKDVPASKQIKIEAETAAAAARLAALKLLLAGIKSKSVVVDVVTGQRYVNNNRQLPGGGRSTAGGQTINEADGAVLKFYADGAHVAQRAPAGSVRVWNEPETGGETYIPHALAKRPRSTAILAQTADEFGYTLTPKGAAAIPPGVTSRQTTYATPVHIENAHFVDHADLVEQSEKAARDKNIGAGL